MQRKVRPSHDVVSLVTIVVAGLLIRLIAAALTGGYRFDLHIMGQWSWHLRHTPLSEFYVRAENPDHLPGDLWLFWLLARLFAVFGGSDYWSESYYFLMKTVPIVADMVITVLLFIIVRHLRTGAAARVTAMLFAFNPATIFVSSFWGQWDAVSMALLLGGLAVILVQPRRWLLGVPLVAWATIVKPPLVLPALFILAWPLLRTIRSGTSLRQGLWRAFVSAGAGIVIGLVTITVLTRPFDVGLPGSGARWSIFERAQIALDYYPYKTLAAVNFWMLRVGSFDQINDNRELYWGLTAHDLGNIYLALSFTIIAVTVAWLWLREPRIDAVETLAWGTLAISYATYMMPTRVHERYLFPALIFAILLVGLRGATWPGIALIMAMSVVYLGSLITVYYRFHETFAERYGDTAFGLVLRLLASANVVLFIAVLIIPILSRWGRAPFADRSPTIAGIRHGARRRLA